MGISKAMMEKLIVAKSRLTDPYKTTLCCTRYGNVMASRGSVIPLFVNQIRNGGPITVTDPNMTRFLMSLDEAIGLVMYAFFHGQQGDTFIQKSPACTIGDLATALKELFKSTAPIQVIGTRHGEKLFETLMTREEMAHAEEVEQYYRIPADNRDLNYNKFFVEGETAHSQSIDYNSHNTQRLDVPAIKHKLLELDYIREALSLPADRDSNGHDRNVRPVGKSLP
jgi:UDP-glucose 4-epimerase